MEKDGVHWLISSGREWYTDIRIDRLSGAVDEIDLFGPDARCTLCYPSVEEISAV